ncbi:MAG TPA: winged helix-turn-helix domain-containing protein [Gemmataceae bacterium]|nr:winged helix-turn-helix domain-containing protein [Gemmataceae bacterium]
MDLEQRVLLKRGKPVPLPPKDIETLVILVEGRGQIVEKKELMEKIWPGTFVEEGNLTRHVFNLRQVLADGKSDRHYIETVPKRGYRFVFPVIHDAEGIQGTTTNLLGAEKPSFLQPEDHPFTSEQAVQEAHWPWSRYRSALALASLLLLGGVAYLTLTHLKPRSTLASHRVMLAVLPVQNLSGDSKLEYVTDGLTEELIAQLGKLNPQQLSVIARTSSMAYKNTNKTITQIAGDLGVDYVLETSLRQSTDRLRFTAQLIRTKDQAHIWAQEYDKNQGDLIAIQDEIGRTVAAQVRVRLSPSAEGRAAHWHPVTAESYDLYLRGRHFQNARSKDGLEQSLNYFQQAIDKDSQNAQAFAGMADSYNLLVFYGYMDGSTGIVRAKDAAEQAVATDETLAEGHAALAYVDFMWLWDWNTAELEFHRSIDLDQNYVPAHQWYALYLAARERPQEAIEQIQVAEILDPRSMIVKTAAGWIYYFSRQPELARAKCLSALALDPNFMVAHAVEGLSYEESGQYDSAIAEFKKALDLSAIRQQTYLGYLGHAYAVSGRQAQAKSILGELDQLGSSGVRVDQINKAVIYAGLNEKAEALQAVKQAKAQNDGGVILLRVNPQFDNLRSEPGFEALLPK